MSTPAQPHYIPVRPDWLATQQEEALDPGQLIVDPHHHLWDRPGWRYLLDELLADLNTGHTVLATVFLNCAHDVPRLRAPPKLAGQARPNSSTASPR